MIATTNSVEAVKPVCAGLDTFNIEACVPEDWATGFKPKLPFESKEASFAGVESCKANKSPLCDEAPCTIIPLADAVPASTLKAIAELNVALVPATGAPSICIVTAFVTVDEPTKPSVGV
jgi:hypothetical protein